MNVVVLIQGREAIPVRAIPLLTNWIFWTPDIVADVLAGHGDDHAFVFGDLQAQRLEDGKLLAFPSSWWKSWPARELQALSQRIKATELTHEVGYQQWRSESLPVLPAGAFVWKDEFEQLHARNWNDRARVLNCSNSAENEDDQSPTVDREVAAFTRQSLADLEKWRELDFSPFIRPELYAIVMEGFEPQSVTSEPAPVVAASAPGGTVTVWTTERKGAARAMMNELKGQGVNAFTAKTAVAFGVTATRLRQVLNEKPKKASEKRSKGVWNT